MFSFELHGISDRQIGVWGFKSVGPPALSRAPGHLSTPGLGFRVPGCLNGS